MAKIRVCISIDEEIHDSLKQYAAERHTTVSQAITDWIVQQQDVRQAKLNAS